MYSLKKHPKQDINGFKQYNNQCQAKREQVLQESVLLYFIIIIGINLIGIIGIGISLDIKVQISLDTKCCSLQQGFGGTGSTHEYSGYII